MTSGHAIKTPGQLAYEADCARRETYHDGTRRKTWAQLPQIMRDTWEHRFWKEEATE